MHYSAPNIVFCCANLLETDLPKADLLICKHVLQHLTNADVHRFITQLNKYKYCLITNAVNFDTLTAENLDIEVGGGRKIDLRNPPFNVHGKVVLNYKAANIMHQVLLIDNTKI